MADDELRRLQNDTEILVKDGETELAINKYTSFIKRHAAGSEYNAKTLALAWNNRGHLRYLSVDFHGAIEDYTTALQLNPRFVVSYYNRGQVHYRMGRFEQAIDDLERALQLDPTFTDALLNLNQAKKDLLSKLTYTDNSEN